MSLSYKVRGDAGPAFVMLHFLGGSGREWDEVNALLKPDHRTVSIDLPGFGGSADETGYGVAEMADAVEAAISSAGLRRYILVGHSMGGKIAMVLARRAQDAPSRYAPIGLVLVAPSPAQPEPITESKRGGMIASLGSQHADDLTRARQYIFRNGERDIEEAVGERAAHELLRMNRTAWVAWLTQGSKEDWAEHVGVLALPALVVAGGKDGSLGPDVQVAVTMPHLGNGRMVTLEGCSHLVPLERPQELASLLRTFAADLDGPTVPAAYRAFIAGERLSPRTREVVETRMAGPQRPEGLLTALQERTLRAMLKRIVPQDRNAIDLAAAVLARLASGKGDGWRYAVLPGDLAAYRDGLDALARIRFESISPDEQDEALANLTRKEASADARWFEEVRSDAVEAYMAHPTTLSRLGYSGLGVGGAETRYRGFITLEPNGREAWEPLPEMAD